MKSIRSMLFISGFLLLMVNISYARDITIIYTGQTHAMLYPCSCPIQSDGGVSRRLTLVKQLKKKYPGSILLDCGAFTAGGLMDVYTQNTQLDMQRSEVNLKAMQLMQYDAVGISPDEFNFGKEFFLRNAKKSDPVFLSANIESDKLLPYIIKESNGVKFGIIGLTGLYASQKSEGLKVNEPKNFNELINRIKKEGAQVIIVLSTLGEKEDLKLISKNKDIDILFVGYNPVKDEPQSKADSTYLLRPSWQGRKLGKLTLNIKDGKLINLKNEEERLSDKIADDAAIQSILPRCYSDLDCRKEGSLGSCQSPGQLSAGCTFIEPNKVSLRIITAKDCTVCNIEPMLGALKKQFPGISEKYIYFPNAQAKKIIDDFGIIGLPAYIIGKEVEKEKSFEGIKNNLEPKGDYYLLKPEVSGISYLFNRKVEKGRLDLFFSIFDKSTFSLLAATKDLNPRLHFLTVEKTEGFDAKNGAAEVEEHLRGVCVQKYYPEKLWEYLSCRSKNVNSSWWDDCLGGADIAKVKSCAKGPEGVKLLKENISLSKELQIMFGPAYLLNNQEIFSSQGVSDKEELKKVIKK